MSIWDRVFILGSLLLVTFAFGNGTEQAAKLGFGLIIVSILIPLYWKTLLLMIELDEEEKDDQ